MKQSKSWVFLLLMVLCGVSTAGAQLREPYTESFEGLDTSIEGFAPKGWKHKLSPWTGIFGLYSMQDGGHSGQYLQADNQSTSQYTYDYLVSPVVWGNVGLWAKGQGDGYVSFYEATIQADGTISIGSELTPTVSVELSDEWQQYRLAIGEATHIAIFASKGTGIDDFSADHAQLELLPVVSMSLDDVELPSGILLPFGVRQTKTDALLTLTNRGDAPLVVSSMAIEGTGFSIDRSAPFTLAENEQMDITVSMTTATTGNKNATLRLKAQGLDDYTLQLAGTTVPTTAWFVDFEEGFPTNMIVGDAWSLQQAGGSQVAEVSQYNYFHDYRMVSPRVRVAAGDKLCFDAAKLNYLPELTVWYSADRTTWTQQLHVFDKSEFAAVNTFKTFELSDMPQGDYYLCFEAKGVQIDNIYGFTPVNVAYDMLVTEQTLPTDGEVNSTLQASFAVRNMGAAIEAGSYTAALYIDNVAVCQAEPVAIGAGATVAYSFSHTPHQPVSGKPVQVRLVAANGRVMAQSAEQTLTVAAETMHTELTVGTPSAGKMQSKVPVYTYSPYSYADILYPAANLPLRKGDIIERIAFKGKNEAVRKGHVKAWIALTDDEQAASRWTTPEDEPTLDLAEWTFPVASDGDMLVLDISARPIVYDGRNLRLRLLTQMTSGYNGNVSYYVDGTAGQAYFDYETYLGEPQLYDTSAPVCYLSLSDQPLVVQGSVLNRNTRQPVAGASIVLKSGDVEYYATSATDGRYAVQAMKRLDYELSASHEGYFPYVQPVSFTSSATISRDIELSEARDFYIKEESLPAQATANCPYTATLLVQNANKTTFQAGSYTVRLYADGQSVASLSGRQLLAGAETQYELSFVPNTIGTIAVQARIEWGQGQSIATTEQQVAVVAEAAEGLLTIGNATATKRGQAPANTFNQASISTMVYTADLLASLPAGADITSFVIKGINVNGTDRLDADVQVWMQNTTDAETVASFDTEQMTFVYDDSQSFAGATTLIDKYVVTLDEPFRYTGHNLRLVVKTVSDDWENQAFEVDETHVAYLKTADTEADMLAAEAVATALPVLHMQYQNCRKLQGTVSSSYGTPIAGATLTLTAGSVRYAATTDADGRYELPVVQYALTYQLAVEAEGYRPFTLPQLSWDGHQWADASQARVSGDIVLRPLFAGKGDVNGDGQVNVTDVSALIARILGKPVEDFDAEAADVNSDGQLNVTDITETINIILKK